MIPSKNGPLTGTMAFLGFLLLATGLLVMVMRPHAQPAAPLIPPSSVPATSTAPEPTPPTPTPSPTSTPLSVPSRHVSTDGPFTLHIGESVGLMDRSMPSRTLGIVKLNAINDSRCKPGVQCIWAGELNAEIEQTDADGTHPVTYHLGKQTFTCGGTLKLVSITETSATLKLGCN